MLARLGLISILPLIVSAADSDLALPSSDDDLFALDTALPLESGALSFNQPISLDNQNTALPLDVADAPLNLGLFSTADASSSLFESIDPNNNLLSSGNIDVLAPYEGTNGLSIADSFKVADCSATFDFLPAIGKSRIKRLDGPPQECKTPASAMDERSAKRKEIGRILSVPSLLEEWSPARDSVLQNTPCWLLSDGAFPWGVCSSGRPEDEAVAYEISPGMQVWALNLAVISTSIKPERAIPT